MDVELYIPSNDRLGEGPVWDSRRGELLWVDIEQGLFHIYHLHLGTKMDFQFDSLLSAVVPVENKNEYLLALQKGLALFNRDTKELRYLGNPEYDRPGNRFNDGKCDPWGRFWIGSMHCGAASGKSSLYQVDRDLKVAKVLSSVSVSNGLAWDESENKMYYIDTPTFQVVSFDFDPDHGKIKRPRIVVTVPKEHGAPDGMCIDGEGMLWIAHWGGANVSRWNPENGRLLQKVPVPALHVTSCCFGNNEMDTLYITSAKSGLSPEDLQKFPLSGSVFSVNPGVEGVPPPDFRLNEKILLID